MTTKRRTSKGDPLKSRHLVLGLVVLALGCGNKEASSSAAKGPAAAPPAAPAAPAEQAAPPGNTVRGIVEETFDASDYTYMRLKTADGEIWAAVGKTVVKKGDTVTVVNAARMDGFESKTLNRKFDKIVFGNLAPSGETGPAPMAPGHSPADAADVRAQMKTQHAAAASGPADVGKIEVKKAEGAGGKTVAEVFSRKGALRDKEVAIRGKVVKFTGGVMGRNWIHLRDGSGTREGKDDDVTVTTADAAAVGDVVLVTGTVRLDKDFGAGYAYPVLIENAKLSK
jgi:hypothetical protein